MLLLVLVVDVVVVVVLGPDKKLPLVIIVERLFVNMFIYYRTGYILIYNCQYVYIYVCPIACHVRLSKFWSVIFLSLPIFLSLCGSFFCYFFAVVVLA